MISTLSLLPLLICICFLVVAFTNYSYVHVQALNLCRKHLLIGQDKIRYQMQKLIKLNPKAKKLREKHDRALRRLSQSKSPPELAVNAALYASVLAQQSVFAARQKKYFLIAKTVGAQQTSLLKKKLLKLNRDTKVYINDFPFALKAQQKLTLTPDYLDETNFKFKQKTTAHWVINNYNQKFLNVIINQAEHSPIKGFCSATINNLKGMTWEAQLVKKGSL